MALASAKSSALEDNNKAVATGMKWSVEARAEIPQAMRDEIEAEMATKRVRSRRPAVLRCLHAIDARRLQEARSWVVSFWILRPFGPSRETAMLRAGAAGRHGGGPHAC